MTLLPSPYRSGPTRTFEADADGVVPTGLRRGAAWGGIDLRVGALGAVLVLALLGAYCLVLASSMRKADRARGAESATRRERTTCEQLAQARARAACMSAASRADALANLP